MVFSMFCSTLIFQSKVILSRLKLLRGYSALPQITLGYRSTSAKAHSYLFAWMTPPARGCLGFCSVSNFPYTYLGLPLSMQKISHGLLMPVIHMVDKRLLGWFVTFLSWGGRLTLINSVLASIPNYFMACFLWPSQTLDKLEQILRGGHCLVACCLGLCHTTNGCWRPRNQRSPSPQPCFGV